MILLFWILSSSLIPKEYQELVQKAKRSSQTKIPKQLRQDTKFPGYYEGEKYQFKLLKTLTNAQTNDIKGFASDVQHCAIVKRKSFSLEDGYAVINPDTQEIFIMEQSVAEEDNVVVYKSTKISVFSIFTNFVVESSTDMTPNNNMKTQSMKQPKASIGIPFLWDLQRDRPYLFNVRDTPVQCGTGCSFSIGVTTKIAFNSIWDVSISFRFVFEGKFGAEVVVPDDCEIKSDDFVIKDFKFQIPGVSFDAEFLGLKISLGAFSHFVFELVDMSLVIPIGFDYYKGYSIKATKFFEITPTSITDSKWDISLSMLSSDDTISSIVRKMLQSYLTATFQLRPFLSLEFLVGPIEMSIEAGVKIPFAIEVGLDKQACKYPHLRGQLTIPIKMYFSFSGLTYEDFTIIKEAEKEIPIYTFEFEPFCIGKPNTYENPEEQIPKYTLSVLNDNFYEHRIGDSPQVEKILHVTFRNDQDCCYHLFYPMMKYNGAENKYKWDRFYYATNLTGDFRFCWYLNYVNENNEMVMSPNSASLTITDIQFVDNHFETSVEIDLGNSKDKTCFDVSINNTQLVDIGNPFIPQSK